MKFIKLFENFRDIKEKWNYSDNENIRLLIKNARKWDEQDFIEEYVYRNDINFLLPMGNIKKGDKIEICRAKRDDDGNRIYNKKTGVAEYIPYKTVIADKDYGDKGWQFILDNTKELQDEARILYHQNKSNRKPNFKESKNTIIAYHASKNKFEMFKSGQEKASWVGSDFGFFFFIDKKNANYMANVIKDNHGNSFLYTCLIKKGKQLILNGEDVGIGWGRAGELEQADIEGYDSVLIKDADTGYGITDELIVFDDDNIKILNVEKK